MDGVREGYFSGLIRLLVTRLRLHPPIEGGAEGLPSRRPFNLPSSARTMLACRGTGRRSAELAPRMAGTLRTRAMAEGAGMEKHSVLVKDQKFIRPLRCSECSGNAHLPRRSPHPVDGMEIRTFECQECVHQTKRVG
jgi:hypothetical protein